MINIKIKENEKELLAKFIHPSSIREIEQYEDRCVIKTDNEFLETKQKANEILSQFEAKYRPIDEDSPQLKELVSLAKQMRFSLDWLAKKPCKSAILNYISETGAFEVGKDIELLHAIFDIIEAEIKEVDKWFQHNGYGEIK